MERLPDTPWHIGYTKKDDNDPRRHKSRCVYYQYGNCTCKELRGYYGKRCPGSAHCKYYATKEAEIDLERSRAETIQDIEQRIKPHTEERTGWTIKSKGNPKVKQASYNNQRKKYILFDLDDKERVEYIIVARDEKTDSSHGVISADSPVGKALVSRKAGDEVKIYLQSGIILNYKVLDVAFIKKEKNIKHKPPKRKSKGQEGKHS